MRHVSGLDSILDPQNVTGARDNLVSKIVFHDVDYSVVQT